MKDLDRIPAPYRERVQRLVTAAREAAIRDTGVRDDRMHLAAADLAARRALVPFLVIADEADAAAREIFNTLGSGFSTDEIAQIAARESAAVWARRMAEHDGDAAPPDLAADAVRAVRSAQRAHLEATRAQAIEPGVHVALHAFPDGWQEVHVHTPTGLRLTLDALVRYLADKPVETLRAVVALMKTLPVTLGGQIDLGSRNRVAHDIIAALPGAIAQETTCRDGVRLAYALAEIDGIEIAARYNPERSEVS